MRFKVPFKGVHIGPTCIDGSAYGAGEDAHAHIRKGSNRDPHLGWICARTKSAFAILMVHEIAHLAADAGHNDAWRQSVHRLGGRVTAAYKKHPRKKP